jgi:hypothetical protein
MPDDLVPDWVSTPLESTRYPRGERSARMPELPSQTPIADMVAQMLADGLAPEAIVRAVANAEANVQQMATKRSMRGGRLPATWQPSNAGVCFALSRGLLAEQVEVESEKFKNYWAAKTGQGATKLDWDATWRNWIISTVERFNGTAPIKSRQPGAYRAAGSAPAGADAILAGMARIARRIDQREPPARSEDRQASADTNAPRKLGFDRR